MQALLFYDFMNWKRLLKLQEKDKLQFYDKINPAFSCCGTKHELCMDCLAKDDLWTTEVKWWNLAPLCHKKKKKVGYPYFNLSQYVGMLYWVMLTLLPNIITGSF